MEPDANPGQLSSIASCLFSHTTNAKSRFKLSPSWGCWELEVHHVWVDSRLECICRHFHGEDGAYHPWSVLFSSSSAHSTDTCWMFGGSPWFPGTFLTAFPRMLLSLAAQSCTYESTLSAERKHWLCHRFLQCGAFECCEQARHRLSGALFYLN